MADYLILPPAQRHRNQLRWRFQRHDGHHNDGHSRAEAGTSQVLAFAPLKLANVFWGGHDTQALSEEITRQRALLPMLSVLPPGSAASHAKRLRV